jgi:cytochrome c
MPFRSAFLAAACAAVLAAGAVLGAGAPRALETIEAPEDLPEGPGRDTVFYMCSACHSMMIVTQQGLSRERWDDVLEWMVEEQGMAELDDATRGEILDYLSTHFDEDSAS